MRRILGLDVGTQRIGVAISDPTGTFAQPHCVIQRNRENPFARITQLCADYEVTTIVVGLPLTLKGERSHASDNIQGFVDRLKQDVELPIEFWDERLSTAQAERVMISGGARRDKRKENIDKVAATLILQSYLDATPMAGATY